MRTLLGHTGAVNAVQAEAVVYHRVSGGTRSTANRAVVCPARVTMTELLI